ncbi:hypothetical protein GW17_00052097 [Ensete ventricosum]|nr:hypothetical protein GW17_00052097 [Ensete ventricosum]
MFQDITTLLLDPKAFKDTVDLFVEQYTGRGISVVAGKSPELSRLQWLHDVKSSSSLCSPSFAFARYFGGCDRDGRVERQTLRD